MPQTALALLALMLATLMSVTMQRRVVDGQREMLANEMEVMATGVALQAMETIRTRAFDQAVVNNTHADLSAFTYSSDSDHFSTGRACRVFETGSDVCDDIDDFHKMKTATRAFDMLGTDIPFTVDVHVQYVGDDMKRYNSRSYQKEVTVYVQDKIGEGKTPFLYEPIEMSRVFSYKFN